MPKQKDLFLTKNIVTAAKRIVNADGTALLTVYTASADDAQVNGLIITSTDSATRIVRVILTKSGVDYILGAASVAANSGANGTATSIDFFNTGITPGFPHNHSGTPNLPMQAGDVLKVAVTTAVTAATDINVVAFVEEY